MAWARNLFMQSVRNGSKISIERNSRRRRLTMPLVAGGFDESIYSFGMSLAGNTLTVNQGWVQVGGRGDVYSASAELTLAAATEYVWVAYNVSAGTAAVNHGDAVPGNTSGTWHYKLAHLAGSGSSYAFTWKRTLGDICLGAPVR